MNSIGIKLADGSFYPILEEGNPDTKSLELTTVLDNQTTVQVDLYKSETSSMDDAQYMDTLEIKNLNPHPNGEPSLSLDITLDENNEVHAMVKDKETGLSSDKQISLITRSEEEREAPANFNLDTSADEPNAADLDSQQALGDLSNLNLDTNPDTTLADIDDLGGVGDLGDLNLDDIPSIDDLSPEPAAEEEAPAEETQAPAEEAPAIDETPAEDPLADLGDLNLDDIPSIDDMTQEPSAEDISLDEDPLAGIEDLDLTPTGDASDETNNAESTDSFDEPDLGMDSISSPVDEAEPAPNNDPSGFDMDTDLSGESAKENDPFSMEGFDEPDLDMGAISTPVEGEEAVEEKDPFAGLGDIDIDDMPTESPASDDTPAAADDDPLAGLGDFDLDDMPTESPASDDAPAAADDDPFAGLGDIDLDDTGSDSDTSSNAADDPFSMDGFDEPDTSSNDSFSDNTGITGGGFQSNMFEDLYDKETLEGKSASYDSDETKERKRTKIPVIICILCAIICTAAVLMLLFVIPSKIHLFSKQDISDLLENPGISVLPDQKPVQTDEDINKEDETAGETTEAGDSESTEEAAEAAEPVKEEPTAEESAPEPLTAQDDAIVIATTPEAVVPETPPAPAEKIPDTRYKIKWGDTLWDISEAFYNNPWRYKFLANYNGIKNPDHIISETWLLIPAE